MKCPNCGTDNLPGVMFCDNCGVELASASASLPGVGTPQPAPPPPPAAGPPSALGSCPNCGQPVPPDARFCDSCGSALQPAAPALSSAQPPAQPPVQQAPAVAPTPPAAPAAATTCPNCGQVLPPGAAFCDQCGASLTGAAAPPTAPPVGPPVTPPPPATRMRLVVGATGAEIPLTGKQEFLIGREDPISGIFPDADLTPHGGDAGGVSRQHAKIIVQGGQIMFEDLNSTNGSWVNKTRVQPGQPVPLTDGAEIRLGRVVLLFHTS